jgi:hypothetical protein
MRFALVVLVAWVVLAAAPKHSFPLDAPVSASINMGGGQTCRLLFRKGEKRLTAVCGSSRQDLSIPILEVEGDPVFQGQILVDDFDFDGYLDLMIPTATGYGGVNWFYDFHHYNAATRSFEPVDDTDSDFCNPEPVAAEKTLRVPCKDGPAWYDNAYKFAAGKPYLYRSSELVHLEGFDGDDAVIYALTLLDPQKRPLKSTVAEATNENKTVRRKLPFEKCPLYRAPSTIGRTESYLVKGDEVELLEVKQDGEAQWVRIVYQSAKAGRLERWITLPPN